MAAARRRRGQEPPQEQVRIPRVAEPCRYCDGTGHQIDDAAVGRMLRERREARGISLREIARRLGKSATYIQSVECAQRSKVGRVKEGFVRQYLQQLEA